MLLRAPLISSIVVVVLAAAACNKAATGTSPSSPSTTTTAAKLAVDRSSYGFPNTNVGDVVQSPVLQVSASGSGSLTVASVTTSNAAEFQLVNDTSCVGLTLTSNTSAMCQIAVNFKPSTAGVRSAQVTVTSSDGGNVTIAVFGTGLVTGSSGDAGGGDAGGGGGGSTGGTTSAGSFPQPPCVPNNSTNISLSILNPTTYQVQITADGVSHFNASIDTGHIAVFFPQPGNYTLDGSVPSLPSAKFFPSTWTLVPGCDYLLQIVANPLSQSIAVTR